MLLICSDFVDFLGVLAFWSIFQVANTLSCHWCWQLGKRRGGAVAAGGGGGGEGGEGEGEGQTSQTLDLHCSALQTPPALCL